MDTDIITALSPIVMILDLSHSMPLVLANSLTSARLFITLSVRLWTTILIAYRIYSASSRILGRTKLRFYTLLKIILQSSIVYALVLVAAALVSTIPQNPSNVWGLFTAAKYIEAILRTVTVCRIIYNTGCYAHKI